MINIEDTPKPGEIHAISIPQDATEEEIVAYNGLLDALGWSQNNVSHLEIPTFTEYVVDISDENEINASPFQEQLRYLKNSGFNRLYVENHAKDVKEKPIWELWCMMDLFSSQSIAAWDGPISIKISAEIKGKNERSLLIDHSDDFVELEGKNELKEQIWEAIEAIYSLICNADIGDSVYDWLIAKGLKPWPGTIFDIQVRHEGTGDIAIEELWLGVRAYNMLKKEALIRQGRLQI